MSILDKRTLVKQYWKNLSKYTKSFTDLDKLNLFKFAYGMFSFRLEPIYTTAPSV